MYHEINEATAKRANDVNSYSDYTPGSATAEYRGMVDQATALAEAQKGKVDPIYHEKIDRLLAAYTRKLAENLNSRNRIEASCPSILVSGGSNFPVRKKEKQNAARDRNYAEYNEIDGLLDKIKSTGTGGIQSGEPNAIEKLKARLDDLEQQQQTMKDVNAWYRKHKTLEGCPHIKEKTAASLNSCMETSWRTDPKPFESWALSNNSANMRRIRERIASLEAEAKRAEETPAEELEQVRDGYRIVENAELCRIQFLFDGKPDEETRSLLKSNGFRWAPSESAWQRMLNSNGRYAAKRVDEELRKKVASIA